LSSSTKPSPAEAFHQSSNKNIPNFNTTISFLASSDTNPNETITYASQKLERLWVLVGGLKAASLGSSIFGAALLRQIPQPIQNNPTVRSLLIFFSQQPGEVAMIDWVASLP
jgi:hypothetical protein